MSRSDADSGDDEPDETHGHDEVMTRLTVFMTVPVSAMTLKIQI